MFASALKKKFNYAQRIASRPDHIFLVRGKDTSGERAWYYVMIDHGKRDMFRNQNGVPYLKLTDYGNILHSGFGDCPPESIRQTMQEEHGFTEQD
jgi:hypothetical protein